MQLPTDLSHPCYHDEEAARTQLESIRWPDGPYCPICGAFDHVKPTATPPKAKGGGWYRCVKCRRAFTVRVGSIFHRSHVPIHKWLLGFRLMAGSKKGFSAHQLHRTLAVDYKTAWFMEHRIRECMDESGDGPLGGEGKVIEADETYIGPPAPGSHDWVFVNDVGWIQRNPDKKMKVLTMLERGGRSRSIHMDRFTSKDALLPTTSWPGSRVNGSAGSRAAR
jgi:transposase-like protein